MTASDEKSWPLNESETEARAAGKLGVGRPQPPQGKARVKRKKAIVKVAGSRNWDVPLSMLKKVV